MDKQRAWEAVLGEFELTLSRANYTTWFKNTSLFSYDDKKATVAVPSTFVKEWIQDKYNTQIEDALAKVFNKKLKVVYEVKSPVEIQEVKLETEIRQIQSDEIQEEKLNFSSLNPKYTFDGFVIGSSNKFAHAACEGVTKKPGEKFNPLFIYGGVGLGKTHLIQAVGNEILKNHPSKKVLYTPSEKFINEFIDALRNQGANNFKNKYRNIDVLIIDDIQFLAGKESTQEEFFHTFNYLYQNNKQIILSSDRPPQAMTTLQERIKSRFEGGMIADIQSPDIETRIAIIQEKCKENSFMLPVEVIDFIAQTIKHNVRELEGALTRLMVYCELNDQKPSLEVAKSALETIIEKSQRPSIKPKRVLEVVSNFYDIKVKDILSKKRTEEIALPRQVVMYILREELNMSFPQIAKVVNRGDHTTIMSGFKKIQRLLKNKGSLSHEIETIKDKLYNP